MASKGTLVALLLAAAMLGMPIDAATASPAGTASNSADIFDYPLPSWSPHCLGFGSEWRYCNGTPLRQCGGVVWLHTGVDEVASAGEPVRSAGDGVIAAYLLDPQFRGGVLIRHQTTEGIFITQYWHVWLRSGFGPGTRVQRGQVFAEIADMGERTHFHFAVFKGDYEAHAWNGALPPAACAGFPAFPYKFVDPNAFLFAHSLQWNCWERHGRLRVC